MDRLSFLRSLLGSAALLTLPRASCLPGSRPICWTGPRSVSCSMHGMAM
jgi:hypothetical protein